MKHLVHQKEKNIAIVVGILVLVSYAMVSMYCHPSGDDFTYALKGLDGNFLSMVLNERCDTNGRYTSNFLMLFSPLNWGGFVGYKLMPVLLIALLFIGLTVFFRIMIKRHSVLLAAVCAVISFSIMPDITEAIYWYTGAWTYTPSALLFLMASAVVIKLQSKLKPTHHFVVLVLMMLFSGFNETIALYGLTASLVFAIKTKTHRFSLLYLTLSVSLFAFVYTAPGNHVRTMQFEDSHLVLYSLGMSSLYSIRFMGEWLLNPAFFLWLVFLLRLRIEDTVIAKLQFLRNPITIIIILVAPVFIGCLGPIFSTGMLGQYRTANLASLLFIPFFTLIVLGNRDYLSEKLKFPLLQKFAFPLLIIFLLIWKNQFYLFQEIINTEIVQFDEEMNQRYALIEACEESQCFIPEIQHQSKTLFVYKLNNDPEHWWNKSYQLYFDSGQIIKSDQ